MKENRQFSFNFVFIGHLNERLFYTYRRREIDETTHPYTRPMPLRKGHLLFAYLSVSLLSSLLSLTYIIRRTLIEQGTSRVDLSLISKREIFYYLRIFLF
jgi:hypothetical protein